MFCNTYHEKKVLITGHTGFKGSWLSAWLLDLGARVAGYSVDLPSVPCNFEVLGLERRIQHYQGDIRDRERFAAAVHEFRPDIVFHLAAQPLVRRSYNDPASTFEVNAMGTLNVLETLRHAPWVQAAVMITSDKAYRNVEWSWGYRENDMLGGEDPYSGSKGCAELISFSYINSFFKPVQGATAVATVRAGNVIGGGDWAQDRIVPDCVRSWSEGHSVTIRSPQSTRPWQHVLEPLSGYLWLGHHLLSRNQKTFWESYNFGPDAAVNQPVVELIRHIGHYWGNAAWEIDEAGLSGKPESNLLKLCCDKALADLGWRAVLSFDDTVRLTSLWYQKFYSAERPGMFEFTLGQIGEYCDIAQKNNLKWALQ